MRGPWFVRSVLLFVAGCICAIIAWAIWRDPRYVLGVRYDDWPRCGVVVLPGALMLWSFAIAGRILVPPFDLVDGRSVNRPPWNRLGLVVFLFLIVGSAALPMLAALAVFAGPACGAALYFLAAAIALGYLAHAVRSMRHALRFGFALLRARHAGTAEGRDPVATRTMLYTVHTKSTGYGKSRSTSYWFQASSRDAKRDAFTLRTGEATLPVASPVAWGAPLAYERPGSDHEAISVAQIRRGDRVLVTNSEQPLVFGGTRARLAWLLARWLVLATVLAGIAAGSTIYGVHILGLEPTPVTAEKLPEVDGR